MVKELVVIVDDFLGFLLEAEVLKDAPLFSNLTKGQTKILQLSLLQITECAYFIGEYCKNTKICKLFEFYKIFSLIQWSYFSNTNCQEYFFWCWYENQEVWG